MGGTLPLKRLLKFRAILKSLLVSHPFVLLMTQIHRLSRQRFELESLSIFKYGTVVKYGRH